MESKQWEEDGEDQHVSERVCVRERIDGVRGGSVHIEMTPRRCAACMKERFWAALTLRCSSHALEDNSARGGWARAEKSTQ